MPRSSRFTPAGVPVHVTQRGNFKQAVFAVEHEFVYFIELLNRYSAEFGNRIIGYCVLTPERDDWISRMLQSLNGKFARTMNERLERKGHVWQGRFGSSSMADKHYRTALAYVDLNPVRAGLVEDAVNYRWSSAGAHAGVCGYPAFLDRGEFSRMYTAEDWRELLKVDVGREDLAALRRATRLGAVLGGAE